MRLLSHQWRSLKQCVFFRVMIVNHVSRSVKVLLLGPLVITTLGVLRNVGLSCSPLLPPLPLSLSLSASSISVPSPLKQGNSLTFLLFSQGYSSIFHSGGTYPVSNSDCGLLDAKALQLLQGIVRVSLLNQVINGCDCVYCFSSPLFHGELALCACMQDRLGSSCEIKMQKAG